MFFFFGGGGGGVKQFVKILIRFGYLRHFLAKQPFAATTTWPPPNTVTQNGTWTPKTTDPTSRSTTTDSECYFLFMLAKRFQVRNVSITYHNVQII